MRTKKPTVLWVLILLALGPAPGPAAEYRIDPESSELVVRVFKAGIGKALAHDHVIRAGAMTGIVEFDRARPDAARLEMVVDAGSLQADEPEVRRRYGLEPLGDENRREIQKTMRSARQLDVTRYPEIEFRASGVVRTGEERFRVTGDFRLHGQTRTLTFPAEVRIVAGALRAEAVLRFAQTDFGIEPYAAAFGAVKNRDEVELTVRLVGILSESGEP